MNKDRVIGGCKQLLGRLKFHWGRFTEDPVVEFAGARLRLAGQIQARYGLSKEQSGRQLQDFRERNREWDPSNQ